MEESEEPTKSQLSNMAIEGPRLSVGSLSKARLGLGRSISRLKVRRQTLGFSGVSGIKPVERTSLHAMEFKRPLLLFLNTYQLEPQKKFHIANVLKVIDEMLDEHFTTHKYNVQESTSLTIRLANELLRKIKVMGFNRYRIIVVVTIGQRRAQSYNNGIAFIWDHERDSYVNTQRELIVNLLTMSEINTAAQKSRLSIGPGHRNLSVTGRSATNLKSSSRMGLRRRSFGFGGVPGIRPMERTSNVAIEFKRPPLVYLPTYQLESAVPFHVETVQKIVKAAISENFDKHKYHSQESPALTLRIAGEIMRSVKRLLFDRYRIICVVTIGQKRAQCHTNAIAFIWDHQRDNYVEESLETPTAFMQVIVFGIYLD